MRPSDSIIPRVLNLALVFLVTAAFVAPAHAHPIPEFAGLIEITESAVHVSICADDNALGHLGLPQTRESRPRCARWFRDSLRCHDRAGAPVRLSQLDSHDSTDLVIAVEKGAWPLSLQLLPAHSQRPVRGRLILEQVGGESPGVVPLVLTTDGNPVRLDRPNGCPEDVACPLGRSPQLHITTQGDSLIVALRANLPLVESMLAADASASTSPQRSRIELEEIRGQLAQFVHRGITVEMNGARVLPRSVIVEIGIPDQHAGQFVIKGPINALLTDVNLEMEYGQLDAGCSIRLPHEMLNAASHDIRVTLDVHGDFEGVVTAADPMITIQVGSDATQVVIGRMSWPED